MICRKAGRLNTGSLLCIAMIICILFSAVCLSGYVYAEPDSTVAVSSSVIGSTTPSSAATGSITPPSAASGGISSPSYILIDASRGQVLLSKNPEEKLHISAACKLMTVLIAIENSDLYSNVTISKESVDAEGSALSLEVGEKYMLEDLLYGIMLTSANDAAKAVAEHVSGSIPNFVSRMIETAAKLKMNNTHFTNPTGLYDAEQYTTASDIVSMIKYAIGNSSFRRVFSARARPWVHQDKSTAILTSPNKLFWSYEGIEGGKMGYNNKEKQSLIAYAKRDGIDLICVVLDTPEKRLFPDSSSIMDYGFTNFMKSTLVKRGDRLGTINVEGSEINLIAAEDIYYLHPEGESYIQNVSVSSDPGLPLKKNKVAGTATFKLTDGTIIDAALYPEREIVPPEDFITVAMQKLKANKDIMYLIYFLIALEIFLLLTKILRRIFRKA
jgi:D-alanyl-D-alanine carboxypeptidase/D-alanyl-D-alanine carboxypeptidase (penicillin-binding protein 5/6)